MAISVVVPGDVKKLDPPVGGTCYKCGCQIRANVSDMATEYHDQRDGATYSVKCPTANCGASINCYPNTR